MSNIAAIIRAIVRQTIQPSVILGTVTAIDTGKRTADVQPIDDSAPLLGMGYAFSDDNESAAMVTPTVGSLVLVAMLNEYGTGYIVATDVAGSIHLRAPAIQLNDGSNGGLVNIAPLVEKFNALEDDINDLKNKISTWSPVAQDGGAALKKALSTWAGSSLTKTQASDLEDTAVTH
jgi:hypothetical protein